MELSLTCHGSRLLLLPRLERAISVIYRPETERLSHHFHAQLAEQFDAVLHFDETLAVEPLEREPHWESDEEPPVGNIRRVLGARCWVFNTSTQHPYQEYKGDSCRT